MAAKVTIGDLTFDIYKLPMLTRLKLDRQVAKMMLPVLMGLDGLDLDELSEALASGDPSEDKEAEEKLMEGLSFEKLSGALIKALTSLSDDEWVRLAADLLKVCSCTHPSHGAVLLDEWSAIDKVFSDLAPLDVYRLAIEVMRENKFSPFALSGAGGGILGTIGSQLGTKLQGKRGLRLGKRAPSTP